MCAFQGGLTPFLKICSLNFYASTVVWNLAWVWKNEWRNGTEEWTDNHQCSDFLLITGHCGKTHRDSQSHCFQYVQDARHYITYFLSIWLCTYCCFFKIRTEVADKGSFRHFDQLTLWQDRLLWQVEEIPPKYWFSLYSWFIILTENSTQKTRKLFLDGTSFFLSHLFVYLFIFIFLTAHSITGNWLET